MERVARGGADVVTGFGRAPFHLLLQKLNMIDISPVRPARSAAASSSPARRTPKSRHGPILGTGVSYERSETGNGGIKEGCRTPSSPPCPRGIFLFPKESSHACVLDCPFNDNHDSISGHLLPHLGKTSPLMSPFLLFLDVRF